MQYEKFLESLLIRGIFLITEQMNGVRGGLYLRLAFLIIKSEAGEMKLSFEIIDGFKGYLIDGGKSGYTVEKYVRDVLKFRGFCGKSVAFETYMLIKCIFDPWLCVISSIISL